MAAALAPALQQLTGLTSLLLEGSFKGRWRAAEMAAVAPALQQLTRLQKL
jgi:hypothetical protein